MNQRFVTFTYDWYYISTKPIQTKPFTTMSTNHSMNIGSGFMCRVYIVEQDTTLFKRDSQLFVRQTSQDLDMNTFCDQVLCTCMHAQQSDKI